MFDHIGLKVQDLPASVAFYRVALAGLGHVLGPQGEDYAGFGPSEAPAFWLYQSKSAAGVAAGAGVHVAFRAANREAVDRFHRDGLAAGARDNGAPGLRLDYGPRYYAAFLIDRDGNNVEAVCLG